MKNVSLRRNVNYSVIRMRDAQCARCWRVFGHIHKPRKHAFVPGHHPVSYVAAYTGCSGAGRQNDLEHHIIYNLQWMNIDIAHHMAFFERSHMDQALLVLSKTFVSRRSITIEVFANFSHNAFAADP